MRGIHMQRGITHCKTCSVCSILRIEYLFLVNVSIHVHMQIKLTLACNTVSYTYACTFSIIYSLCTGHCTVYLHDKFKKKGVGKDCTKNAKRDNWPRPLTADGGFGSRISSRSCPGQIPRMCTSHRRARQSPARSSENKN